MYIYISFLHVLVIVVATLLYELSKLMIPYWVNLQVMVFAFVSFVVQK